MSKPQVCLDIETTTDHKTIRLVGVTNTSNASTTILDYIGDARDHINDLVNIGAVFFTWNGSRFDLPVLETIGVEIPNNQHIDGMLLMKMLCAEKTNRFSMDAACRFFDTHFRPSKPDNVSWYDTATLEELASYLSKDLSCTRELRSKLVARVTDSGKPNAWLKALLLEQRVARLVHDQVQSKVHLDCPLAIDTAKEIAKEMEQIESDFSLVAPEVPLPASQIHHPPKVQFKKDGTPSQHLSNYLAKYGWREYQNPLNNKWCATDGRGLMLYLPLTEPIVKSRVLTLSNQAEVKDWLIQCYRWRPAYWNYANGQKTSPRFSDKVTGSECPDLTRIAKTEPVVAQIQRWLMLRSRKNIIDSEKGTGWVANFINGNLYSDADTLGANTARFTHKVIANVPRVTSEYGKEMRSMLRAKPGKVWVGWDATSLEAICEAHWCYDYDYDYAMELIDGDVHTKNLNSIPLLKDRAQAKTLKYALTYGAQAPRVAQILGCSESEGRIIFTDFWNGNTALLKLKQDLIHQFKRKGSITTIDGREIFCRSEHSLVNALFQSTGAIIMKYAMVMADQYIRSNIEPKKHNAIGLIKYHDEEIWECLPDQAEKILKVGCASVTAAAKNLGLKVPLQAEGKIGDNWAEVH